MIDADGGCYCGEVRYRVQGEPLRRAMCLCRECQHIAGGGPNFALVMRAEDFNYTQGVPRSFARTDIDPAASREFCGTCGTQLVTRSPRMPTAVVVKVGSLDDPSLFGMPEIAGFAHEKQQFHIIPDCVEISGMPA